MIPDLKPGEKGQLVVPFFFIKNWQKCIANAAVFAHIIGVVMQNRTGEVHRIWKPKIRPLHRNQSLCAGRACWNGTKRSFRPRWCWCWSSRSFSASFRWTASSMVPTLVNGDKLIVWGAGYDAPARGCGHRGQLHLLRQAAGQAGHRQRRRHHLHRLRHRHGGGERGSCCRRTTLQSPLIWAMMWSSLIRCRRARCS